MSTSTSREDRLLAHKRQVDAERKAQAILRDQSQRRANIAAILAVAGANKPAVETAEEA